MNNPPRTPCQLINLTPHEVVIIGSDGAPLLTFPPRGTVARLTEILSDGPSRLTVAGQGVQTFLVQYNNTVENLPAPTPGTVYLVSRVLAQAVIRPDLFFPIQEIRDRRGQILGCRSLGQFMQKEAI